MNDYIRQAIEYSGKGSSLSDDDFDIAVEQFMVALAERIVEENPEALQSAIAERTKAAGKR